MTMPATVKLSRRGWGSSHSRRARPWKVEVDGKTVGTIPNEETVELQVEPGRHALRVRSMQFLTSPEEPFEADEGQVVGFSCHPRSLSPIIITRWIVWLLVTLVKHDLWIDLKPEVDKN
jgi:hypothetical protein